MRNIFAVFLCLSILVSCSDNLDQTKITGRLLGHDGIPMKKAHVHIAHLTRGLYPNPIQTTEVSKNGNFELAIDLNQPFILFFSGVHHKAYRTFINLKEFKEIKVDVRLGTYDYYDHSEYLGVLGNFNDYSPQSKVPMKELPDGGFSTEIQIESGNLEYQLSGAAQGIIIAGSGDEYFYKKSDTYVTGGYVARVFVEDGGLAKVTYNKKDMPDPGIKTIVDFKDPEIAGYSRIYESIQARQIKYNNSLVKHMESGGSYGEFIYDWTEDLAELKAQIESETNPEKEAMLFLAYFQLERLQAELDPELAQRGLEAIPASSPSWSLVEPEAFLSAAKHAGGIWTNKDYYEEVLKNHTNPDAKASLLGVLIKKSHKDSRANEFKDYFGRLLSLFPDTWQAQNAKREYAIDRSIVVGKDIPAFSFASLNNTDEIYSKNGLMGKLYLIDLWATWCGPCVAEMENLHKTYEKFKEAGFEILSISLDPSVDEARSFQKNKWPMPWLNAFSEGEFDSKAAELFEVTGIPTPILVDRDGKIIAMESDLRGENLEKTLLKHLKN
ncbi:MAG: redoxin domain-containing protein [Candidatus Aminicenantes bacterium]|nr:redoxin domain-containing protein [Candidatus Aminicenantes bacterium]